MEKKSLGLDTFCRKYNERVVVFNDNTFDGSATPRNHGELFTFDIDIVSGIIKLEFYFKHRVFDPSNRREPKTSIVRGISKVYYSAVQLKGATCSIKVDGPGRG